MAAENALKSGKNLLLTTILILFASDIVGIFRIPPSQKSSADNQNPGTGDS